MHKEGMGAAEGSLAECVVQVGYNAPIISGLE